MIRIIVQNETTVCPSHNNWRYHNAMASQQHNYCRRNPMFEGSAWYSMPW